MAGLSAGSSDSSSSPRIGAAVAVVVAAAFIALLVFGLQARAPDRTVDDALSRGDAIPAPGFTLATLSRPEGRSAGEAAFARAASDGRVALTELRGTAVILNFWASWCAPCRDEAPVLERTWRGVRDAGVLVLGLNMQDARPSARRFLGEQRLTFPQIRDPTDDTARLYGASGLPETYFITPGGRIVDHVIGVISEAQLAAGLAAARSGEPRSAREGGEQRPTR